MFQAFFPMTPGAFLDRPGSRPLYGALPVPTVRLVARPLFGRKSSSWDGRLAQRESTPFTRVGSKVQSLQRPPFPKRGAAHAVMGYRP